MVYLENNIGMMCIDLRPRNIGHSSRRRKMGKDKRIISCCGVICSECESYPKECKGCPEIEGNVYWLEYMGGTICDIYNCCVNQKKYAHCGQCSELPCKLYEVDDPTKTSEENAKDQQKQLEQLKKMS